VHAARIAASSAIGVLNFAGTASNSNGSISAGSVSNSSMQNVGVMSLGSVGATNGVNASLIVANAATVAVPAGTNS
jgi:hypothetical protein